MISLTRLNGQGIVINAELIESLEQQIANTVVSLSNGNKILVKDTVEEIVKKVHTYRGEILAESERIKSQRNEKS